MKNDTENRNEGGSRRFIWTAAAIIVLAIGFAGVLKWRRATTAGTKPPYVLPFHPEVTYDKSEVTIRNTEAEPYLDTSLIIYVEGTRYSAGLGTIQPGETIRRSLSILVNERGDTFRAGSPRTSELEVRARFGGYDVHKDFPPPP
jgi:hypothetical protein